MAAKFSTVAALVTGALALPHLDVRQSTIPSPYQLVASAPGTKYDGARINWGGGFNLFQEKTSSYCPTQVGSSCPNGTDSAFAGSLFPLSLVPGGQDSYVSSTGLLQITVQHSHALPAGGFWTYQGLTAAALNESYAYANPAADCPKDDPKYNCKPITGLINWKLTANFSGEVGTRSYEGVYACPNPYSNTTTSVFVNVPGFDWYGRGCEKLQGLGTVKYEGPNPPVWAY